MIVATEQLAHPPLWLLVPILTWVSVIDFIFMRIPNIGHIALIFVFSVTVLPELSWSAAGARFLVVTLVFIVAFLVHTLGALGAGDVKLLATTVMFIPPQPNIIILWILAIALAGIPAFFVHSISKKFSQSNQFPSFSEPGYFPYGPAISIGLVLVILLAPAQY